MQNDDEWKIANETEANDSLARGMSALELARLLVPLLDAKEDRSSLLGPGTIWYPCPPI